MENPAKLIHLQSPASEVADFLLRTLETKLPTAASGWIKESMQQIAEGIPEKKFYGLLGKAPAIAGKKSMEWSKDLLTEAACVHTNWDPSAWTCAQAARAVLLLTRYTYDPYSFPQTLRKYFDTADFGEQVLILRTLPLLPEQEKYLEIAALGVRSNIKPVSEAIALQNPYPAAYFDMPAWNQMVLKVLFTGSPLYKIQKLDERHNAQLASMLLDFAAERMAAGRKVSPELWRPVGPYINSTALRVMRQAAEKADALENEAIYLACSCSSFPPAKDLLTGSLKEVPADITWDQIGEKCQQLQNN